MEDEILKRTLATGPDCLSLDEIGRYADGALDPNARSTASHHLAHCLTCQAELALMQSLTAPALSESKGSKTPNIFPVAAAAAVALMVMAAGSYYFLPRRAPQLPSTVPGGREITRSLALGVRSPVGDQQEAPRRFEWVASDGAVRYRVRLMEVDRRELWTTAITATAVEVPSTVLTSLTPGRSFIWDVIAYDAADRVIADSGSQSFRILSR